MNFENILVRPITDILDLSSVPPGREIQATGAVENDRGGVKSDTWEMVYHFLRLGYLEARVTRCFRIIGAVGVWKALDIIR